MNKIAVAFVGAAIVMAPAAASAATLSLAGSGYVDFILNSSFDLDNIGTDYTDLTGGYGVGTGGPSTVFNTVSVLYSGAKNATNGLYVDGPATVTYTYLGKEASFTNNLKFAAGDTTLFTTAVSDLGDTSGPFDILAGLLPFKLTSNSDADVVFNNAGATTNMNIAYLLLSATSALVFLDDFGAGPDSDFDDIGIRIDIAAVPLPAGLPLLAAGLGLLGWVGSRRRRDASATTA
jgi:hypothetical protein